MKKSLYLLVGIAAVVLTACGGEKAKEQPAASARTPLSSPDVIDMPALSSTQLASYIKTLASDEFEGRGPSQAGGAKTVAWLEAEMNAIGLKPGNGDSYLQEVPLVDIAVIPAQSSFVVNTPDGGSRILSLGDEMVYWTKRVQEQTSFTDSEMVFVGYGVVAPEYDWDDYAGIDVTGKTVVMMVNDPGYVEDAEIFNGRSMTYYGRWTYKFEEAARQGAAAAIIIHQEAPAAYPWTVVEGSWTGGQIDLERPDGGAGRVAMEAWVTEATAASLFEAAGLDFEKLQEQALNVDFTAVPMGGLRAEGTINNVITRAISHNVAGVIEGAVNPDEYILFMAHWDHLGKSDTATGDAISNGAVDNATGTAGILTMARSYMAADHAPERSIMFLAVTAEESGLLGSAYFGEAPLVPLKDIVGGINIDALLPAGPSKDIIVVGYGSSELEDLLSNAAAKVDMYLRADAEPQKGYFYRSDHISLAKKGVPMLYADSGIDLVKGGAKAGSAFGEDYTANRYHQPSDEYTEDWDLSGMIKTFGVLQEVGTAMAYSDIDPNWFEGNEFRALRDAQKID